MTHPANAIRRPASLLSLESRSPAVRITAILLGTIALTLSSYITVPMYPVPMTMQTFAILMVGALYGWRLGALTIIAWLGEAAAGMPVLAGGAGGLHVFAGPTGGYIFSWPFIAALVGWLVAHGWNGHRPVMAFAAMLLATAICLVAGAAWLSAFTGFEKAIALGVTPFILGGILKSALGAVALTLIARKKGRA